MPDGIDLVAAALVSIGEPLGAPALLSVPRPPQLTTDRGVLLVRLQELGGETRLVLVGVGVLGVDRLVSDIKVPGSDVALDGVRAAGRYLFVKVNTPFGFAAGQVTGVDGAAFAGALVSANSLPFVALSRSGGGYIVAAAVGA